MSDTERKALLAIKNFAKLAQIRKMLTEVLQSSTQKPDTCKILGSMRRQLDNILRSAAMHHSYATFVRPPRVLKKYKSKMTNLGPQKK